MKKKVDRGNGKMYAVDFRNMRAGIHGLYYGTDKMEVQDFYSAIKNLQDDEFVDEEEYCLALEDLMRQFSGIDVLDEVNYRHFFYDRGRKMYEGEDGTKYTIVNPVSVDAYCESCCKSSLPPLVNPEVSESSEDDSSTGEPSMFIGTYAKYNNGENAGEWVTLTDFDDYEDFVSYCREIHKDEKDPEFMVQDVEYIPRSWYHESGLPTEEEFYNIVEFADLDDSEKKAYSAYLTLGREDNSIESFRDAYYGRFTNEYDLGYESVENIGMPRNPEYYFDYEAFGRDLTMDFSIGDPDELDADGEPQEEDWYYDSDGYKQFEDGSNQEIGERFVDDMGGVELLGKDTISNYFDYETFGRELLMGDLEEANGYLFWMG